MCRGGNANCLQVCMFDARAANHFSRLERVRLDREGVCMWCAVCVSENVALMGDVEVEWWEEDDEEEEEEEEE